MSDEKEDALRKQAKANLSPKGWEALLEGVERVSDAPVSRPIPEERSETAGQSERHILRVRDESGRVSEHVTRDSLSRDRSEKTAAPHLSTSRPEKGASTPYSRDQQKEQGAGAPSETFGKHGTRKEPIHSFKSRSRFGKELADSSEGPEEQTSQAGPAGGDRKEETAQETKGTGGLIRKWVQKQPLLQKLILYYRGLTIRDQRLLVFTSIGLSLLFVYLGIFEPMMEKKSLLDRKVATKKADLAEMVRLRSSVVQDRGGMDRIKSIINQRGRNFSVFAYLEQLASKAEMKNRIVSIKPQRETPVGQFKESLVSVKLDGIGMEELTRYLYQIETSEDLLYVKNLQIKKVSSGKGEGMDVTLSVGTLKQG